MNQVQQRFLLNRLDEARRSKPDHYDDPKLPKPAAVKKAEADAIRADRIISAFRKKVEKARKVRNQRITDGFQAAKQAVLFATSPEAIKAIERFERASF